MFREVNEFIIDSAKRLFLLFKGINGILDSLASYRIFEFVRNNNGGQALLLELQKEIEKHFGILFIEGRSRFVQNQ